MSNHCDFGITLCAKSIRSQLWGVSYIGDIDFDDTCLRFSEVWVGLERKYRPAEPDR